MYFYSPSSVLIIFLLSLFFLPSFAFFAMHLYSLIMIIFFPPAYPTMSSLVGVSKSA